MIVPNNLILSPKHGEYLVGNQKFVLKFDAIEFASKTNQPVTWDFNSHIFSEYAKKPRLNVPLETLYKLRCQQLRDNYDYIILAYSGGSDSDTILKSFIDNNIKLDEVWTDQPLTFVEKNDYVPNTSLDNTNLISEWYFVIKPELEKLRLSNPEIKIHVSDSSGQGDIEDYEDSTKYIHCLSYTIIKRWRYINQYVNSLREQNKKVCVLIGIEKTILYLDGDSDRYGFQFIDNACITKQDFVEYFYWTPDMPEIVVEQTRAVWDYLKNNMKESRQNYNDWVAPNGWRSRSKILDNIIKRIIYPSWDMTKHQVNKPGVLYMGAYDKFIDKFKDERFYQSWEHMVKNRISQLNPMLIYANGFDSTNDMKPYRNVHFINDQG